MPDPSEMREPAAAYGAPAETAGRAGEPAAPEPWSHPWHDQLGLLYHRAMAEKIRRQPALINIARENLRRWIAVDPEAALSPARREWQGILDSGNLEAILRFMTDPTEEGHRRRQSTPFAGILTAEERNAIRAQLL
jgi:hypothetical protein